MDPIVYQVILSRLSAIAREMMESVFRTGYSTIIRESQDASCLVLDADGYPIGETYALPTHVTCMASIIAAIRRDFGATIAPGDAFITNHPYDDIAGTPHSIDMAAVTPVFCEGQLIAFCGSIAHKSDLGGVVPGTSYGLARELFQEGIMFPPVRFVAGGRPVADIEAILRANSRTPELILGDLRGQIGSARLGERRIAALVERYGIENVLETGRQKHNLTERRTRSEIARWADGVHEAESFIDNDGVSADRRVRFHVRVEKRGDRIIFDFSGSDDQAAGAINVSRALARGASHYAMIATIDKTLPNDGGLARVVEMVFRRGSVIDPIYPAARSAYTPSVNAMSTVALEALSGFVPTRRMANSGGEGGMSIAGRRPDGSSFNQYELLASAWGAIVGMDGKSGMTVLQSNPRTAPVEILESEFPTRLLRYELIRDCGGSGEMRGGLAQRRVYEILTDDAQLALRGGLHDYPARGLDGGGPGRLGRCTLNPDTPEEQALPNRFAGVRLRSGDVVALEKAGGGGLGDPRRRPFERVLSDVLDGYVSRAAAVDEYGVDVDRLDAEIAAWEGEAVALRARRR